MENIFRWSSCQADFYSSSDSSASEESDHDESLQENENRSSYEYGDKRKKRYTNAEMLDTLAQNNGDFDITVANLLQDMTSDSLNHLSSQNEEKKKKKKKNLRRKLVRLKAKVSKFSKDRIFKEGEKDFISESQDSFVMTFKGGVENEFIENDMEFIPERETFRKPLDMLKDRDTAKERTNKVMDMVRVEAEKQRITTTQLLAYLMYRDNYTTNRKFALNMHDIFMGRINLETVPTSKAIAICSRGKFGRTNYNYIRRSLKPHKDFVKNFY